VPGGRRLGVPRQAGQYRAAPVNAAHVAAPVSPGADPMSGGMESAPSAEDKVDILLVDDQPSKLLTYEAILGELGENLIKAHSAQGALESLLKRDVAVILVDVCMPELDGFELARMIRGHPRFQKTAIILVSALLLSDLDRLKGYGSGAV